MAPACLYNSATDSAFTFLRCFLGTVLRRRPVTVNSRLSADSGGTGTVDNLAHVMVENRPSLPQKHDQTN